MKADEEGSRKMPYKSFSTTENEENRRSANKDAGYTFEEAIEAIGFGWGQIKIYIILAFGIMADMTELFVVSILGAVLMCDWRLSYPQAALITTVTFTGYLIGGPIFGLISDHFGRTKSLLCGFTWLAYYGVLSAFSPIYTWLIILRFSTGFGLGVASQSITYLAEILPSNVRGRTLIGIFICGALGGPLVSGLAVVFLRFSWRAWLISSTIPTIIYLILLQKVPPSPKHELACGRLESARKLLESLSSSNNKPLPEGQLQCREVKGRGRLLDLVTPEYRTTSLVLGLLWLLALCTHYSLVLLTTELIKRASTCTGTEAMILLTILVDRVRRKLIWYFTISTAGVCCAILCFCLIGAPMLAVVYIGRSCASAGHYFLYIYTSEAYPTEVRGLAMGCGTSLGRIGALLSPFIAQVLLGYSMLASFIVLAVFAVVMLCLVFSLPANHDGQTVD